MIRKVLWLVFVAILAIALVFKAILAVLGLAITIVAWII